MHSRNGEEVSPAVQRIEVERCCVLENALSLAGSIILSTLRKTVAWKKAKTRTHWGKRCAIQRRIQHLRHIQRCVRHVYLYLAQLLVPQCLALRFDLLKARAADLGLRIRARLGRREERHADAERDLGRLSSEREERTGLVGRPTDEVDREVEVREAEALCIEAVSEKR